MSGALSADEVAKEAAKYVEAKALVDKTTLKAAINTKADAESAYTTKKHYFRKTVEKIAERC